MSDQRLITLLVVDRSPTATAFIANSLRDAGFEVQELASEQETDIYNIVEYKPIDLILVGQGDNLPSVATVCNQVAKADKIIPVLAVLDNQAGQNLVGLLRAGAANLVYLDNQELASLVVEKELRYAEIQQRTRSQDVRLQETENRCVQILESIRSAIAYIHEGVHSYANPAYLKLFDYGEPDELLGAPLLDLFNHDDHDKLKRLLRRSMRGGVAVEPIEITAVAKGKRSFPARITCAASRMNEEPCLQILVESVAEQVDCDRRLEEFSKRELYTGLFNRYFFSEYVEELRAAQAGGAVLYVLLSAYRSISEELGLEVVDGMVKELSKVLVRVVSEREVIARFSDAVFTVYTPYSSQRDLMELGTLIKDSIKGYTSHAVGKLISTTASIGICPLLESYETVTDIFLNADRACEAARQMGGDQVRLFSAGTMGGKEGQPQDLLLEQLREAISNERLQPVYQPIANFEGDSTERYKVFLRILDENQQPLPMSAVLPIAEQRNLMGPLDKWLIARCLDVLVERLQAGESTPILFVGISANSLLDENFCAWLEKRLTDTSLLGNILVMEVVEETAEQHFIQARRFRQQIGNLRCGFALAHFGGRPNSERLLEHLNPDYIKLEGSLIEQLVKVKDEHSRQVIMDLTAKAQAMQTQVVASRVSTAPQMASIWQFGVTLVQGDMVQEIGPEMDFDFQQFAG